MLSDREITQLFNAVSGFQWVSVSCDDGFDRPMVNLEAILKLIASYAESQYNVRYDPKTRNLSLDKVISNKK